MNDDSPPPVHKTHAQVKAERLQSALRENLRRRKAAGHEKPLPDQGIEPDDKGPA